MTPRNVAEPGAMAAQTYQTSMGGTSREPANLGDILERVLDKGLVIAGDIQVNLLDIELLTIKLRLVIASLDTARQVGINWWEADPWLSADALRQKSAREGQAVESRHGSGNGPGLESENRELRARIRELESGDGGRQHARRRDDRDDG